MYRLPSSSQRDAPSPRATNGGSPPTARKAGTGESTPPGKSFSARCCKLRERVSFMATSIKVVLLPVLLLFPIDLGVVQIIAGVLQNLVAVVGGELAPYFAGNSGHQRARRNHHAFGNHCSG